MKRSVGRQIARGIGRVLLAVLILLILLAGWLVANGWLMYREAMKTKSLTARVEEARAAVDYIPLSQLPALYPKAVVAVEDRRFYLHGAIDPVSIVRAIRTNLSTGSFAEGGSTITQQLAKNLCFTQQKRLDRKVAEIFAAYALEKHYTKDELLELYINTIYYGSGYTGLTAASTGYFGCPPAELSDVQCTILAGLPNAPSVYSPDVDPELTLQRQKQVLAALVQTQDLTQAQADALAGAGEAALARWLDPAQASA